MHNYNNATTVAYTIMCADITLPEPQPLIQAPAPFGNSSQRFKGDELQQQCEQDEQEQAEQKAKS